MYSIIIKAAESYDQGMEQELNLEIKQRKTHVLGLVGCWTSTE